MTDLFPYFLKHTNEMYPHLTMMDDLKQISDLTEPSNWYPDARSIKRKVIYHAGPTNSGKTYTALKSFQTSDSGIYCSPLKLLANEVYNKTNAIEAKCDLVTGEERKYANADSVPANHMACTVEMTNLEKDYDVAVIDEIQMIKDQQRGWAWTRAFLGLKAKEIHLCGDQTAIDLISDLCFITQDEFQIFNYERLTPLHIMNKALESFDKVEPGDCFVCFSKNDIFSVVQNLENRGYDVAVIYGSMPPGVKLAQAARFNDPNDKCKILVATDAVGMGLNLNIRRVIFYSIRKPQHKEKKSENDKESMSMEFITPSQALQIAGRAGRFNTAFKDGLVTCFNKSDLSQLLEILKQPLEKTEKAGLHPTADQIELFAYHLPDHSLSNLLKIFMSICKIDDGQYFLCNFDDIISLAEMIDHIPIKLRAKYTFATAPISLKQPFVCSCFVRFVRSYSNNEVITEEYLKKLLDWPFKIPNNLNEVTHLENVYDVLDLYLWLGHRFPDVFLYKEQIINMRVELESVISEGVTRLANIYKSSSNQLNNKYIKNNRNKDNNTNNNNNKNTGQLPTKQNIVKNYTQLNKHQQNSNKNYGSLLTYLKAPTPSKNNVENQVAKTKTKEKKEEKKQQPTRPISVNKFQDRVGQIIEVVTEQNSSSAQSSKTSTNESSGNYDNLLTYLKTTNTQKMFETNVPGPVDNLNKENKTIIQQNESEKSTQSLNDSSNVKNQETIIENFDKKILENQKSSIIDLFKSGTIFNSIKQAINSTDKNTKKDSADQETTKK